MSAQDRRHSIIVTERFVGRLDRPAEPAEVAAALLHDVGKIEARLGTFGRVAATVWGRLAGPERAQRGSGRFATYLRHEAIGAELLAGRGSAPRTVALVAGEAAPTDTAAQALAWADDI